MKRNLSLVLVLLLASSASADALLAEFKYSHSASFSGYSGPQNALGFRTQIVSASGDFKEIKAYTTDQEGSVIQFSPAVVETMETIIHGDDPWFWTSAKVDCRQVPCGAGYGGQIANYPFADGFGAVSFGGYGAEMTYFAPVSRTLWNLTAVTQTLDAVDMTLLPLGPPPSTDVTAETYGAYTLRFYGTAPGIVPEPAACLMLLLGMVVAWLRRR